MVKDEGVIETEHGRSVITVNLGRRAGSHVEPACRSPIVSVPGDVGQKLCAPDATCSMMCLSDLYKMCHCDEPTLSGSNRLEAKRLT